MNIDLVTLKDLGMYAPEGSVFELINMSISKESELLLRKWIENPPITYSALIDQQEAVRFLLHHDHLFSRKISNGTIIMIRRFYEANNRTISKPNAAFLLSAKLMKKFFKKDLMAEELFSLQHFIDLFQGCHDLMALQEFNPPSAIQKILNAIKIDLDDPFIAKLLDYDQPTIEQKSAVLAYTLKTNYKSRIIRLIGYFVSLDSYHALAKATKEHNWNFPEILPSEELTFDAKQFYHPIIQSPVKYDLSFDAQKHFLFLTGANMSGKSTLIRTIGITSLLAHLGCGVPADSLKISFLKGIITNMHIEDNIFLGESFFFSEVQRMHTTAQKLHNSKYYLVLMDELFKGTNVHDAYECSAAVIKGLLNKNQNLMALSTHLYELHDDFKNQQQVFFKYFITDIDQKGNY